MPNDPNSEKVVYGLLTSKIVLFGIGIDIVFSSA
jgi:hypothetical protein